MLAITTLFTDADRLKAKCSGGYMWLRDRPLIVVLFLALLLCAVGYSLYRAGDIHFYPPYLTDQIGFIGAARHLVDYGHFIDHGHYEGLGSLIFPGTLSTPNTRIYMPVMFLALASSYKLFGVSGFTTVLPNMLCYVLSSLLLCFIGARLYSKRVGMWSAIIFLTIPVNLFYALNAMMEMPLVMLSLLAFAVFIVLPARWRLWAIPLLLIGPHLTRRVALLLLLPMLAFHYDDSEKVSWWQAGVVLLLTLAIMEALTLWQVSQGMLSFPLVQIFKYGHVNYLDAYADHETAVSMLELVRLFFAHLKAQITEFFRSLFAVSVKTDAFVHVFSVIYVVMLAVVATIGGFIERRQSLLPMSCGLFFFAIFSACLALHSGNDTALLRVVLFSVPFTILQAVRYVLDPEFKQRLAIFRFAHLYRETIFIVLLSLSTVATCKAAHYLKHMAGPLEAILSFVESVQPDQKQLLVTHDFLLMEYAYKHYPANVAFVPKNRKTLELLNRKYPVGTVIIAKNYVGKWVTVADIESIGLTLVASRETDWGDYLIFKRLPSNTRS